MTSSPSEDRPKARPRIGWRLGAGGLFAALMAASALTIHGLTPLFGAAATPASVSKPLDRAAALLAQATGPYDEVTFCEPPKAYVPDLVQLGMGSTNVDTAPFRPVILCPSHALDFPLAALRAQRDRLTWVRRIADADLVAFAADEASFRAAMVQAGSGLRTAEVRPFTPLLAKLHSNLPGAVEDPDGWRLPAHPQDEVILFGPYLDLGPGVYRMRLDARLTGSPDRCRRAIAQTHPSVSVTRDAGAVTLSPKMPAPLTLAPDRPCSLAIETTFTVPAGGAKLVETPLSGPTPLPILVEGYVLEPVAAAQSR